MWATGETLNEAIIIGSEENGLYKLKGHPETCYDPCHRKLMRTLA